MEVWADIYRDGHDVVAAALVWRREIDREWRREPMSHHNNDRWGGSFVPDVPGRYVYAIEAWTDEFATWRHGFELKQKAGADITLDAIEAVGMLVEAHGGGDAAAAIIKKRHCEEYLRTGDTASLLTADLSDAMAESQQRPDLTLSQLFPFSRTGRGRVTAPGMKWCREARAGSLANTARSGMCCASARHCGNGLRRRLFHADPSDRPEEPQRPQQRRDRQAKAIRAVHTQSARSEGGHDAVHPELGTLEDFRASSNLAGY